MFWLRNKKKIKNQFNTHSYLGACKDVVVFFFRFMITFSPVPSKADEPQSFVIFDIRTGQKKRGFHCEAHAQPCEAHAQATWPIFK